MQNMTMTSLYLIIAYDCIFYTKSLAQFDQRFKIGGVVLIFTIFAMIVMLLGPHQKCYKIFNKGWILNSKVSTSAFRYSVSNYFIVFKKGP